MYYLAPKEIVKYNYHYRMTRQMSDGQLVRNPYPLLADNPLEYLKENYL